MSSFYLACTGVFISSIKMLCFSDGFLHLLWIFNNCDAACRVSPLERYPGKSASVAVRWVPSPLSTFSSRASSLSSLEFRKRASPICVLSQRKALPHRVGRPPQARGSAAELNVQSIQGECHLSCRRVSKDLIGLLRMSEESREGSTLLNRGTCIPEVLRTF